MVRDLFISLAGAAALIQQFLPAGVAFDQATDEQISAAVSQAVGANPQASGQIVSVAVQGRCRVLTTIFYPVCRACPRRLPALGFVRAFSVS